FDKHLKDGVTLMLIGTAEEITVIVPTSKPTFVEDLSENQLALVTNLPRGIVNLGNTCYVNASIQCLRMVPEIKEALIQNEFKSSNPQAVMLQTPDNRSFVNSISHVIKLLEERGDP
ncbi:hypothetical protein, partial [Salmonella sp. s51228]|uniref:hypothetical protein n=1 Tax=Salmonella sp. s51228 TaxID=3159652 RepID=UPI00397F6B6A